MQLNWAPTYRLSSPAPKWIVAVAYPANSAPRNLLQSSPRPRATDVIKLMVGSLPAALSKCQAPLSLTVRDRVDFSLQKPKVYLSDEIGITETNSFHLSRRLFFATDAPPPCSAASRLSTSGDLSGSRFACRASLVWNMISAVRSRMASGFIKLECQHEISSNFGEFSDEMDPRTARSSSRKTARTRTWSSAGGTGEGVKELPLPHRLIPDASRPDICAKLGAGPN